MRSVGIAAASIIVNENAGYAADAGMYTEAHVNSETNSVGRTGLISISFFIWLVNEQSREIAGTRAHSRLRTCFAGDRKYI